MCQVSGSLGRDYKVLEALEQSLKACGMFSKIVEGPWKPDAWTTSACAWEPLEVLGRSRWECMRVVDGQRAGGASQNTRRPQDRSGNAVFEQLRNGIWRHLF